jgi:hypothetical protein
MMKENSKFARAEKRNSIIKLEWRNILAWNTFFDTRNQSAHTHIELMMLPTSHHKSSLYSSGARPLEPHFFFSSQLLKNKERKKIGRQGKATNGHKKHKLMLNYSFA